MGKKINETKGLRQRTHKRVDNIMDKAESMSQIGKEKMAHVKEGAIRMIESVDGYIKKNPKKTVMVATGVGVVAGAVTTTALMRRKHKNQS